MKRLVFLCAAVVSAFIVFNVYSYALFLRDGCQEIVAKRARPEEGNPWSDQLYLKMKRDIQEIDVEIVYFCDSVMFGNRENEKTLSEIIASNGKSVVTVAGPGFSAYLYREYVDILGYARSKPVVVMGVNPRSFSRKWADEYSYKALAEFIAFDNWKPSMLESLWYYVHSRISNEDLYTYFCKHLYTRPIDEGGYFPSAPEKDNVKDDGDHNECVRYENTYSMNVALAHPLVKDIHLAVEKAKSNGMAVLVYITPINYSFMHQVCGVEAVEDIDRSIGQLAVVLRKMQSDSVDVADFSKILPGKYFSEPEYPNEHLTQDGREILGLAILDKVNGLAR